jgi:hypothetical protein
MKWGGMETHKTNTQNLSVKTETINKMKRRGRVDNYSTRWF